MVKDWENCGYSYCMKVVLHAHPLPQAARTLNFLSHYISDTSSGTGTGCKSGAESKTYMDIIPRNTVLRCGRKRKTGEEDVLAGIRVR